LITVLATVAIKACAVIIVDEIMAGGIVLAGAAGTLVNVELTVATFEASSVTNADVGIDAIHTSTSVKTRLILKKNYNQFGLPNNKMANKKITWHSLMLVSQSLPVNPGWQLQVKLLMPSKQVALFMHGFESHSSMLTSQLTPEIFHIK
jgi:sialic acid synthase SpsE